MLTVLGRWAWGPCQAIDTRQNHAYIGNGATFQVLDISNPSSPTIVGELATDSYFYDIRVRDSLAFAATGNSLLIIDISNPSAPKKVSEVAPGHQVTRLALSDSIVYVAGPGDVVQAIDVSDPAHPRPRGICNPFGGGRYADLLMARGTEVYFSDRDVTFLFLIDASNPDTLRVSSHVGFNGFPRAGFVRDTLLLICVTDAGLPKSRVLISSVSTPSNPLYLGSVDVSVSVITSITADSTTAYLATAIGEAFSIDIADPSNPAVAGTYSPALWELQGGRSISRSGRDLLVAQFTGVRVIDAAKSDSLRSSSFFPTGGWASRMVVRNNVAFVASGFSGLWILDMSNPSRPATISNINVGGTVVDVVVTDNLAFLANTGPVNSQDTTQGLWTFDISDIFHPRATSHHTGIARHGSTEGNVISIASMGTMIVMTQVGDSTHDSTLEVIDVHDPANPSTVSVLRSPSRPLHIQIQDSIAYIADETLGLRVVDLHRPDQPVQLGHMLRNTLTLTVLDTLAFVIGDSLWVVDIANPHSPITLSTIEASQYMLPDAIAGGQQLFCEVGGQLLVYDISSPRKLALQSTFTGDGRISGVATSGDTVFASTFAQGVWVLRNNFVTSISTREDPNSRPTEFELSQNYPNPFNPTTEIRYQLPTVNDVKLTIYDVLGREVAVLVNEREPAGRHTIKFEGSGLASGVYFYRLKAGAYVQTKKLLLLR